MVDYDYETLEKIDKSFEMIDKRFGGNITMKREILIKYGFSLDNFPTLFEPSSSKDIHTLTKQESNEKALEFQNKAIYGDKWYVLQNRLLNAITNLDLNERRLIMYLSPMVRKDVDENPNKNRRVFTVRALDFAKTYKIKPNNVYKVLSNTADTILTKAFWFWNFKDDKLFGEKTHKTGMTWVSKCNYLDDRGEIEIYLSDDIIEMLTVFNKANPFTKYQIDAIVKLGCYGIILFEIISNCLNQNFKQRKYTVAYLKEKFNCVDNYKTYYDFKRYVLDRAIKEIHDNTTIKVSYEQKKQGRKVSEIIFYFKKNSENKSKEKINEKNTEKTNQNPFVNFKMSQKQLSLFATKIKKATGQDIDEIINELCNVHLQSKHIDFLKVLDFVPSDWYTENEMKDHLTAEQIAKAKTDAKLQAQEAERIAQDQLKKDFEKLIENAEMFVKANLNRVSKTGIEQIYLKNENYIGIVKLWEERYLLNATIRNNFALVDDILEA